MELENRNANGSPNALPGAQQTSGPGAGQESSRGLEQEARQKAEEAREQIHSLAEVGKDRLAEQLDQVARALRATGENLRGEEQGSEISHYTESASERIERVSQYLREHRAIDLVDGVERFARERPGLFLGGALVLGLAVGRFLKSKPDGAGMELDSPSEPMGGEGFEMGGYDVQEGYPEPREPVVGAPIEKVGTPAAIEVERKVTVAETPEPTPPGSSFPYQSPSGTFRGPGDGGGENKS